MKADAGVLGTLAITFATLSLMAIGGANSIIPEMHRQFVEVGQYMTDRQFADLFAISQAAPGPNILIVTLIGYQVAGPPGALVATLAVCGPSCVMTYFVARAWERFKDARWRIAIQAGLVPVSIGLIASGAYVLTRAVDHTIVAFAITGITAAIAYATRLNPLWMFAAAALLGFAGYV